MVIRNVNPADRDAWLLLAEQVEGLFGAPGMACDPSFLRHVDKKLATGEALIAVDEASGSCLGVLSISKMNNHINWFAVDAKRRGHGVGTELLRRALNEMDSMREVTVETFRDDNAEGAAALAVYRKFSFVIVDNTVFDPLGNPRCKMALPPHPMTAKEDQQE